MLKLNYRVRLHQSDQPLWSHRILCNGKRCFICVIISHAWKWLFFTKCSQTLRQPSEPLCNRRPCYFHFREAATVTVQFAVYSGATGDRRHETRQTREGGSLLKSFRRARARAFTAPQISNDHRCIIPTSPFCAPQSLSRRSILSPTLPSVLFA